MPTLEIALKAAKRKNPWKLHAGAEVREPGVFFKVWAPEALKVDVILEDGNEHSMRRSDDGYFSRFVGEAAAGTRYWYGLGGKAKFPDPCSRFQPEGSWGPSEVIDPNSFRWTDTHHQGPEIRGQIFYEMHVGTFTKEGTFESARRELSELKKIGITTIEIMPVSDCPGRWNWGYDGVNLYAPAHYYGTPGDFKRFINEAHSLGLNVILDVVYNHYGPSANFVFAFSEAYKSDHPGEWGAVPNLDGSDADEVRRFFIENACYWISEYHLDGLRIDATQNIIDKSAPHFLKDLTERARKAADGRKIIIVGENEPQDVKLLKEYGFDALWTDDFHHSARVAMTGFREAYFTDYEGKAQELAACVKCGFLFQGQYYKWQKQNRGTSTRGLPASSFIFYLQDHDQIANYYRGLRPDRLTNQSLYNALTALLFLSPVTPLLFMGQEFGSSSPFMFFMDHEKGLAKLAGKGRMNFLSQFSSYANPEAQKQIPEPSDETTFYNSKLDFSERRKNAHIYQFHKDLIRLRKEDPVLMKQSWEDFDSAALNDHVLIMRYWGGEQGGRLVVVNLGPAFSYDPVINPLMAAPQGKKWELVWSSLDEVYTGKKFSREKFVFWKLPAQSALFFKEGDSDDVRK